MSMEYIRRTYRVPAKRGVQVEYIASDGERMVGTIVGSKGAYIRVRFGKGNKRKDILSFHPTYNLQYLTNPPYDPQNGRLYSKYEDVD
jgi:hypothetical protein